MKLENNRPKPKNGFYGKFGGAFIPELLHKNVSELEAKYQEIIQEPSFQTEYQLLLKDYRSSSR